MGKERLKEITMEIVKLEESLSVMNYINSMSDSDIHLFMNYVKSSKYSDMNIYSAVMNFSLDYLKSIKCL